ncbi:MAG: 3-deoxy-7-phosphoheptulonate synthase [Candidatus Thiodiazotropha sp.]
MADRHTTIDGRVCNTRVSTTHRLITPLDLLREMPVSDTIYEHVLGVRQTIHNIINGSDDRPMVIVGPCSIHDPVAAMDYAERLKPLADAVSDQLYVVMRVYFEKPRTTIGWKGLINDPAMNGSFDMDKGLRLARQLLLNINSLGLATATEILEPFTPQYIGDLLGWVAIGARTTESQTHRQLASGLSTPVGFKNSTDGNTKVAIDAMLATASSHTFLGVNELGETAIVETTGNDDTHLILRGGSQGSNYDQREVFKTAQVLLSKKLNPRLMVDCSHANSGNNYSRQVLVWCNLLEQINRARSTGQASYILGAMLESNINAGRQDISSDLAYGVSITDACIDWDTTEQLLFDGCKELT